MYFSKFLVSTCLAMMVSGVVMADDKKPVPSTPIKPASCKPPLVSNGKGGCAVPPSRTESSREYLRKYCFGGCLSL